MRDIFSEFDVNKKADIEKLFDRNPHHIRACDYHKRGISPVHPREYGCMNFMQYRLRFIQKEQEWTKKCENKWVNRLRKLKSWFTRQKEPTPN